MPRVGRHPLKNKGLKPELIVHQQVTVTTIVHIPMLSGYWQESLKVLKLFFESLYANTNRPIDLMVFDNGSCDEVQNYLLELKHNGKIQYLIFSKQNLKKLGALNFLLSAAPGDYVAYADSDVYFLPGWLDQSISVLNAFPEAGKVTALPMIGGKVGMIASATLKAAQTDPTIAIQTGILVPDLYTEAHRISIGQSKEAFLERTKERQDILIQRNGTEALISAADFEFVITRKALESILPLNIRKDNDYFDPIYSPVLENRLSELGYWQLSTPGYFVHHMGNAVPDLKNELPWHEDVKHNHSNQLSENHHKIGLVASFKGNQLIRGFVKQIHVWTYRFLFENS